MTSTRLGLRLLLAAGCGLAWLTVVPAPGAAGEMLAPDGALAPVAVQASASGGDSEKGTSASGAAPPSASATLQQCLTSPLQSERSATFEGEMTAVAGTARMEISINLLERTPAEMPYRAVSAPGLGAWRGSAPGVKIYTYIKQVNNLSAPAFYRGAVRFRWLNAKGRTIKLAELRTSRCEQTAVPAASEEPTVPAG